jgi:hypothetical protein
MERRQLEMRLENPVNRRRTALPHRRRTTRARWWFDQMRRAVDEAEVWQPAEPSNPQNS